MDCLWIPKCVAHFREYWKRSDSVKPEQHAKVEGKEIELLLKSEREPLF
jgi:hypothetical protein